MNKKPQIMMTRNAPGAPLQQDYERRELTVRSFTLRADTIDEDARTVEAVIATEAPTMVLDMNRWEIVEEILLASGMRVASDDNQVPLLDTHNRHSVSMQLGSCRNIRAAGAEIIGVNHFSSVKDALDCFTKIREGHVRDNSVGYQVLNYVTIEAGQSVEIEGRQFTASADHPLRVTTEWVIKENSVCPIGADANAKMRGENGFKDAAGTPAAAAKTNKKNRNDNQPQGVQSMREYLISLGMRADATDEEMQQFIAGLSDDQRAAMPTDEPNTPAPTAGQRSEPTAPAFNPALTDEQRAAIRAEVRQEQAAALRAERERATQLRTEGTDAGVPTDVIERCIVEGLTLEQSRGEFLTAVRNNRTPIGAGVNIQTPGNEITRDHLAASMLLRGNVSQSAVASRFGQDVPQQAQERCRRMSLLDTCRMALVMGGHDAPLDRDEMIRTGFSTGTLPTILGDVAHIAMLAGFDAAAGTWEKWCSVKDVSDFRDHNLVRFNINGGLEQVGNGGEVKTFERSEEKRSVAANDYAKNLIITRRDMINDNAGAFMDAARKLGRIANQGVSNLVYTVLLANVLNDGDSTALFSTDAHTDKAGNAIVNLQASSALSIAKLTAAIALFRKFREFNGDPIDVDPGGLLVPPELEGTAHALVSSELIVSGNTTAAAANNPNAHVPLEVIVDSRLSNANYTGYSATSWYLVPKAGDVDLVSVAFLNGVRTPQLTQFNLNPDRLGAGWQVLFDYGAAATDIYGVKSNA